MKDLIKLVIAYIKGSVPHSDASIQDIAEEFAKLTRKERISMIAIIHHAMVNGDEDSEEAVLYLVSKLNSTR